MTDTEKRLKQEKHRLEEAIARDRVTVFCVRLKRQSRNCLKPPHTLYHRLQTLLKNYAVQ